MSEYGVFWGPYFAVIEQNTEISSVNLPTQSDYPNIETKQKSVFRHISDNLYISKESSKCGFA